MSSLFKDLKPCGNFEYLKFSQGDGTSNLQPGEKLYRQLRRKLKKKNTTFPAEQTEETLLGRGGGASWKRLDKLNTQQKHVRRWEGGGALESQSD